jgi:proteasome lid subunit RPN8/RPN11
VRIRRDLLDAIVDHARRDAPNECCGMVASRDGDAVSVHAAENTAASPFRFEVDGNDLGAIYHSHTRSEPYPSQTDVNFAANWPGVEWIIVGLANGDEPLVRSYLIDDGVITEVPVAVD